MKNLALIFCGFGLVSIFPSIVPAQNITTQPQSITVNNASTAEFSVVANNAQNYQWQFNDNNLSDGGNISGSSTANLTLRDVSSNQAGSYSVFVDNVPSSNAVLTIIPGTIVRFTFSGLPNGTSNTVDVQLFNHDKPATVENFIHYITSSAFTNMFFERCLPGFILQGGDFGATDRTNTTPPITGWAISTKFTIASNQPNPPYPPQVDSEFNVGPLIHNTFGTIAMALIPGDQNSASSGFFFNLADNSANLDFQNGGFTVFGQILDGTNVLQYFNGLSAGNGIAIEPDFLGFGSDNTNLPVNYTGTNIPANANLVFCDFQLSNAPPPDTNAPTVSITSPVSGALFTTGQPFVQGTASDDVGVAAVICALFPQAAADGSLPNGGLAITNFAFGTTNWAGSFSNPDDIDGLVPPGEYVLEVQAQDGAGNLSPTASVSLTISTVSITGGGTVTYLSGNSNYNAVGYPFTNGGVYNLLATPDTNQLFVNWSTNGLTLFNSNINFAMADGNLLTVTFNSNTMPNSLAITYPTPNATISTNAFKITGTFSNVPAPPVTVICQIYSATTFNLVGPTLITTSETNWSVNPGSLPVDSYVLEATAVDNVGDTTVATENFTVSQNVPLQLIVIGPGTVTSATNGETFPSGTPFQVTAIPDANQFFYDWNYEGQISLDPTQNYVASNGLIVTATFVSNTIPGGIAFTSPAANASVGTNAFNITGTISNVPVPPASVTVQIFSQSNLLGLSPALTTTATNTNWSVTGSGLSIGDYIAEAEVVDQANNSTLVTENFTVSGDQPVASILTPTTNAILPEFASVTVSGTSSDTLGLASMACFLVPTNTDGIFPNGGDYIGASTVGTTNWSINFGVVPPGTYLVEPFAQNNLGNFNQINQFQALTVTGVLVNGNGSVTLAQGMAVLSNAIGFPLQNGVSYTLTATPAAGQTFLGWSEGALIGTNPTVTYTMAPGVLWTANFIPNNTGEGVLFTYPAAYARLRTNAFQLKGKLTSGFESIPVTYQISSLTTAFGVGPFHATSGARAWSAEVTNLPPDNYVVQAFATNAAGQPAVVSEEFTILAFIGETGTYSGLFICTNNPVRTTNSGFITFTVQPSGVFSGRLVFPAYPAIPIYSLAFENIYFNSGYFTFAIDDFHGSPLTGTIVLDLSGNTDLALGAISSRTWTSPLICHRAVTKLSPDTSPATGKYVLNLQPTESTNSAGASGYASFNVGSGGVVAVSGALPDKTTFSESTTISKEGIWPAYAVPAGDGKNGLLIGWETNSPTGSNSGALFWYKAPNTGAYYKAGVGVSNDAVLSSAGTNFARPTAGSPYSIVFEGGTIATPLTNALTVNNAGQFVVSGKPADKLTISLSANGVLTGSLLNPGDNKTLQFKGAFISPSQGGSGFIPDADGQTGSFELARQPQ